MGHLDVNHRLNCLSTGLQSVDTTDDTRRACKWKPVQIMTKTDLLTIIGRKWEYKEMKKSKKR